MCWSCHHWLAGLEVRRSDREVHKFGPVGRRPQLALPPKTVVRMFQVEGHMYPPVEEIQPPPPLAGRMADRGPGLLVDMGLVPVFAETFPPRVLGTSDDCLQFHSGKEWNKAQR